MEIAGILPENPLFVPAMSEVKVNKGRFTYPLFGFDFQLLTADDYPSQTPQSF